MPANFSVNSSSAFFPLSCSALFSWASCRSLQNIHAQNSRQNCQHSSPISVFYEPKILRGRFGYFLFFLLGGGEGGVRGARKWGESVFIENPRRRGGVPGEGGGGVTRKRDGVCRELGGGGAKYFFEAETPTKIISRRFSAYTLSSQKRLHT